MMKSILVFVLSASVLGGGLGALWHLASRGTASPERLGPPVVRTTNPPLEAEEVQLVDRIAVEPAPPDSEDIPEAVTLPNPVGPIDLQQEYEAALVNYRNRLQEVIEERRIAGVANTVFLPASNQPQAVEYPLGKDFQVDPETQLHFRSLKGTEAGTEIYDEVFEILEYPELFEMRAEVARLQKHMRYSDSVASGG